ncbi:MAG: multicopper oxidase domain-containing protein, partial [Actinomycetes bacterium]
MTTDERATTPPTQRVEDPRPTPHALEGGDPAVCPQPEEATGVPRRHILTWGAIAGLGGGVAAATGWGGPVLRGQGLLSANGAFAATSTALSDLLFYKEVYPTSPLILHPFTDELLIPPAMRPVDPAVVRGWAKPPGPGAGQQNSMGNETHQIWPSAIGFPDPIVYKLDLKVAPKVFTTSKVRPITSDGKPARSFDAKGNPRTVGTAQYLPVSTIYGFDGTFPGPRINAEYGKPVIVRFENRLQLNPYGLDRQDFGSPDFSFLTHLHNAHTAPESDGNPHYSMRFGPQHIGYRTGTFVDNLYLNWPAGGD